MNSEELRQLNERGMRAWDEHDTDGFLGLFADEFVWRDLAVPEPISSRDQGVAFMQGWFTAFPDMRVRTTNEVVGEDCFAGEVEFTGTNTGPLAMGGMEIPATGRSVVGRGAYFVKVNQDGKITEFTSHPDSAGLMAQLGLIGQEAPTPADA